MDFEGSAFGGLQGGEPPVDLAGLPLVPTPSGHQGDAAQGKGGFTGTCLH